jgi:hypothetical protein
VSAIITTIKLRKMCIFELKFTHKNNHYVRHFQENNRRTSKFFEKYKEKKSKFYTKQKITFQFFM